MGVYRHPTEDRTFFAPDREPTMPSSIPVWHISGLDNFSIPRPASLHKNVSVKANTTTGSCPSSSYCGSDMRTVITEAGRSPAPGNRSALLEYYGFDTADLNTYLTNAGQTNAVPINGISADKTSVTCLYSSRCDDTEQILDITQAISMAPGLRALNVFVGSSDTAILAPCQRIHHWTRN